METFFGIIFGGIVSALAGVGSHFLIERLNLEKVRRGKFLTALTELEQEICRLLDRIDSPDFERTGFQSREDQRFERHWDAVRKYLSPKIEFDVLSEAKNAISCLGSGDRQHMKDRLRDFLNKVIWLINTADNAYCPVSKR
jgi:hypothetical protein